jgi:hypothetical protein
MNRKGDRQAGPLAYDCSHLGSHHEAAEVVERAEASDAAEGPDAAVASLRSGLSIKLVATKQGGSDDWLRRATRQKANMIITTATAAGSAGCITARGSVGA